MRQFVAFLFLLVVITGCEKAVDFNLEAAEPKLVVEATIENGQAPVVILSRSSNFFAQISPELLAQSFVRNAEVYVSNGVSTHRLKEFTVPTGNGYSLSFYTNDPAQPATAFVGTLKTNYTLEIITDGKEFTAQTTIPDTTRRLDSIWWKPVPNAVDDKEISLYIRATDRPGFGDYIRYFTKKNSGPYLPPFTSVFDDFIIDGSTYELVVEPGFNRNIERNDEDYYFKRGDTINLKLANIDRATYDFWRTMEYGYNSVGNPFSTPVKVLGNITGGGLGYFGGYGVQYKTMVVPK